MEISAYRLYLRTSQGIAGRLDFEADDDWMALTIAEAICDACSDLCTEFEVWDGPRRVEPQEALTTAMRAATEARTIETEEALLGSLWAVARSRRLLERYRALRPDPTEA